MWDALMDKTLTVKRATLTQDAQGGDVRTYATVLTGVVGAIQSASSYEIDYWKKRDISVEEVVLSITDFDTALTGGIQAGDIFVCNGVNRLVTGFRKDQNDVLSTEPLYEVATIRFASAV